MVQFDYFNVVVAQYFRCKSSGFNYGVYSEREVIGFEYCRFFCGVSDLRFFVFAISRRSYYDGQVIFYRKTKQTVE